MKILGIESSCDECAAAVVEDGRRIVSNVVATQVPFHEKYRGVVPELASRMHTEWIRPVVAEALEKAGWGDNLAADTKAFASAMSNVDGVAVTCKPGLVGSLLVSLQFAKGLAWAAGKPFVGVNHILAHLYAPHLEFDIEYPYVGLLVSGGHTIICRVDDFDELTILGTTIDDAVGEAFDKVAKYYDMGYPGGVAIDRRAKDGNPDAYRFPMPALDKAAHRYDVSYSGLKTAVINQLDQFRKTGAVPTRNRSAADAEAAAIAAAAKSDAEKADIAASFQKAAIDILLSRLFLAVEDTGIRTVVAGGGVAANSFLRAVLAGRKDMKVLFPPLSLCTDNAAMIAGLGYQCFRRGETSPWSLNASSRVPIFKRQTAKSWRPRPDEA